MNETEKRFLKCDLTEAEILEYSQELAHKISDVNEKEVNKKASASQYKSEIDILQQTAASLARKVNEKAEYRDVECWAVRDYTDNDFTVTRIDTGEIIEQRPLRKDEMQMKAL